MPLDVIDQSTRDEINKKWRTEDVHGKIEQDKSITKNIRKNMYEMERKHNENMLMFRGNHTILLLQETSEKAQEGLEEAKREIGELQEKITSGEAEIKQLEKEIVVLQEQRDKVGGFEGCVADEGVLVS